MPVNVYARTWTHAPSPDKGDTTQPWLGDITQPRPHNNAYTGQGSIYILISATQRLHFIIPTLKSSLPTERTGMTGENIFQIDMHDKTTDLLKSPHVHVYETRGHTIGRCKLNGKHISWTLYGYVPNPLKKTVGHDKGPDQYRVAICLFISVQFTP